MTLAIFVDLDGTVLDVSSRYYSVYACVTRAFGGRPIGSAKYWRLRRARVTWGRLLELSEVPVTELGSYLAAYIARIEAPAELARDVCLPGAVSALQLLYSEGYPLYLVSLRRDRDAYLRQIDSLALPQYFTGVLSAPDGGSACETKAKLIATARHRGHGMVIGDTEADVLAGKRMNMMTVAVRSGIRSQQCLEELAPDYSAESIRLVPDILGTLPEWILRS